MSERAYSRRTMAAMLAAGLAAPGAARAVTIKHVTGSRIPPPANSIEHVYQPPTTLATVEDAFRRMTAQVKVDDQGPFGFVVDTGANQSVISQELATQLGLPQGAPQPLHSVAGVTMTPTVTARTMAVGDRVQREVTLSVLPGEAIGGAGLLGIDRLNDQLLTLDFKAGRMRIENSHRTWRDPLDITVRAKHRDGQLTLVDSKLDGVSVTAFLDSGAQSTIGNMALRRLAQVRAPETIWLQKPILSVTGQTIDCEYAILPTFKIGGLLSHDLGVAFADLHTFKIWNLNDQPAILLGVDILSRFEFVSLDFARGEVRFRLPRTA